MKELSGKELIKFMAQQAKNRMRGKTEKNLVNINTFAMRKNHSYIQSTLISNDVDEKLYSKVCFMLEKNEDIVNPLDKLIDLQIFSKLAYQEKERYLLELADKYIKFKDRYEVEKLSKSV